MRQDSTNGQGFDRGFLGTYFVHNPQQIDLLVPHPFVAAFFAAVTTAAPQGIYFLLRSNDLNAESLIPAIGSCATWAVVAGLISSCVRGRIENYGNQSESGNPGTSVVTPESGGQEFGGLVL